MRRSAPCSKPGRLRAAIIVAGSVRAGPDPCSAASSTHPRRSRSTMDRASSRNSGTTPNVSSRRCKVAEAATTSPKRQWTMTMRSKATMVITSPGDAGDQLAKVDLDHDQGNPPELAVPLALADDDTGAHGGRDGQRHDDGHGQGRPGRAQGWSPAPTSGRCGHSMESSASCRSTSWVSAISSPRRLSLIAVIGAGDVARR